MVGVGGSFACIARDGLSGAENFNPKQRLQRPPVCLEGMGWGGWGDEMTGSTCGDVQS